MISSKLTPKICGTATSPGMTVGLEQIPSGANPQRYYLVLLEYVSQDYLDVALENQGSSLWARPRQEPRAGRRSELSFSTRERSGLVQPPVSLFMAKLNDPFVIVSESWKEILNNNSPLLLNSAAGVCEQVLNSEAFMMSLLRVWLLYQTGRDQAGRVCAAEAS